MVSFLFREHWCSISLSSWARSSPGDKPMAFWGAHTGHPGEVTGQGRARHQHGVGGILQYSQRLAGFLEKWRVMQNWKVSTGDFYAGLSSDCMRCARTILPVIQSCGLHSSAMSWQGWVSMTLSSSSKLLTFCRMVILGNKKGTLWWVVFVFP
jgi:hypothetical protein